jgi:Protein of unknown function (DUF3024)
MQVGIVAPRGWTGEYEWTSMPIAQLRFNRSTHLWRAVLKKRGERWHKYDRIGSAAHVEPLLAELDADPMARLWG